MPILANLKNYIISTRFTVIEMLLACGVVIVPAVIFIIINSLIHKKKVKLFNELQASLLAHCQELEGKAQEKKTAAAMPSELEDKLWHEAETDFVFKLHEKIASAFSREEVVKDIAEGVHNFINVNQTILLLLDKATNQLKIAFSVGVDRNTIGNFSLKKVDSISGMVLTQERPIQVDDLDKDKYYKDINKEPYLTGSFVSIPIIFEGNALGVLNVCNKKNSQVFSKKDLSLLTNVGKVAAIALQNISLYEQIKDNYIKTIASLASAIDARDPYTKFHSENVTRYSLAIAQELQMATHDKEILTQAALLHDIGKIGVRDNVLLKNAKLTPEEFEQIKTHSSKGEEMIKSLSFLKEASLLIRHHHERFDGNGYPDKIKGHDIELGARIIAVADTFDAMTTDRPYRKGLSVEQALEESERCSGTQLDPEIVVAFKKILSQNPNITHPAKI